MYKINSVVLVVIIFSAFGFFATEHVQAGDWEEGPVKFTPAPSPVVNAPPTPDSAQLTGTAKMPNAITKFQGIKTAKIADIIGSKIPSKGGNPPGSGSGNPLTPINPPHDHNEGMDHHDHGGHHGWDHWYLEPDYWQSGSWVMSTPITTYTTPSLVTGKTNLWVDTPQGRMQYAVVPQYSQVSLIASTSLGGQGVVYELYPITTGPGAYTTNVYNFNPGENQLGFAADIPGRHILLYSINNQISNGVAIDVQGSGINPLQQQVGGGLLGQGVGV